MNKSTEVSGVSVLVFRILLSGIFITAEITWDRSRQKLPTDEDLH